MRPASVWHILFVRRVFVGVCVCVVGCIALMLCDVSGQL